MAQLPIHEPAVRVTGDAGDAVALLEAALGAGRDRGADRIDLGTGEHDRAARALYERLGFSNRERPPDGPLMYVYERGL